MSDSKKHTLSKCLTWLTVEGQKRTSTHDESTGIESDLAYDEENRESSVMIEEVQGSMPLGVTSHLIENTLTDTEKHTLRKPLKQLTNQGQNCISSHDESKEIENNLTNDEENKENSIMSQERRVLIPSPHLAKRHFTYQVQQ